MVSSVNVAAASDGLDWVWGWGSVVESWPLVELVSGVRVSVGGRSLVGDAAIAKHFKVFALVLELFSVTCGGL